MKEHVSSLGIAISIAGVVLVYLYSPLNESVIGGGDAFSDSNALAKTANSKNTRMRFGVCCVVFGSLIQLVANYIPSASPAA